MSSHTNAVGKSAEPKAEISVLFFLNWQNNVPDRWKVVGSISDLEDSDHLSRMT